MTNSPRFVHVWLRSSVSSFAIASLLLPAPALAGAPQVDTVPVSPVTNVTREQLENVPTSRDLADLIRTCPAQTIPTVTNPPQTLINGKPVQSTPSLDCVQPDDLRMIEVYKGHNDLRAQYGVNPLRWNPVLAQGAQSYANQLAQTGQLAHSSREGRGTVRENLSQGLPNWGVNQLMGSWFKERQYFQAGTFPNVSTTGDWYQVGHYSQIIWPTTTDIGCGLSYGGGSSWLVCRYDPGGNKDGKQVGFPLIIAQGGPPVININNPQPVQAAPPPPPPSACTVAEGDDWLKLLHDAALKSGLAPESTDPRDATTDRQWDLALQREQDVQDRMMKELAGVQGDVAKSINAYLAATSAWQERYSYIASSTTGLQGLLTNWMEARAIYEKADLAFALMNLGVGGVKLGFKAYKFLAARRAAAAIEAAEATAAAGTAARTGEAGAAALGETQAFNRTLIPPGQQPNVLGMQGYTGASSVSGKVAQTASEYANALSAAQQRLAQARAAKDGLAAWSAQTEVDNLVQMGAAGYDAWQARKAAAAFAEIDSGLVKLAREAGVNVEKVATGANAAEKEWALLKAIAQARGWHDIPAWANTPITNVLLQTRKILGGVKDAKISPQDLELLKSLKTYVESRGLNFAQYLRTAAGEVQGGIVAGETKPITEIIRYYDEADINLLLRALDSGGDAAKLRNAVSPVTQASLNGLARAAADAPGRAAQAAQGACGAFEGGVNLTGVGGAGQGTSVPGGRPSDAQLNNVLNGLGDLGQVGLGNVVDQFGVTDRFTAGQGYGRAVAGELWELITSPSTTVASFYYTNEAQTELLNLLQNEQGKLIELGTKLDEASRALRDLQSTLQKAGLSGPESYLGNRGPADLRRALDELQRAYNSGTDDWKRSHKDQMDERRNHITQKLADLSETVADLNALAGRMQQVRAWLDSLRLNPDGSLRGPVDVFNPQVFVRLGSIALYLRGMAADAFGLTTDAPFRVSVPQPQQPAPQPQNASQPVESWDQMMERLKAQSAALDAKPEVEVDPDLDAWLNGLDSGK